MSGEREAPAKPGRWTAEEAERYLLSLELFGMRFGLDRMRRLMTVLERPNERFSQVHVVGTNGKSSTTRMIAALLERHGLRTGAYTSPHLLSYWERVELRGRPAQPEDFAAAVGRAVHAAELVNHTLAEDDRVTQFELLTAAAFEVLAGAGVEVAIVEAGLGGRYDATNVIDSRVAVLTNVGLEHTRWLGPTITDIAREKLDVVRPGATLVLGAGLHPDALAVAREVAAERNANIVHAQADTELVGPLRTGGSYQRRNFALALAAAEAYLGRAPEREAVRGTAAELFVPGRFQVIDGAPPVVLDGAHNPDGIAALGESLLELAAGRRIACVVSILDDKDAAAMLAGLMARCQAFVCTRAPSRRALPPGTLVSLARQLGGAEQVELEPQPLRALERARELAGTGGVVLVTGSIYLIAELMRGTGLGEPA